ncbi:hypothetical protein TVAG_074850 [Trichomonas vaginalis G3]|uniref:Leucine Rich Repeat family protein n=1 Tax=Trichomonas vaginalis (strain ATCC PRA-98 / G3) TaxID=412133 RepID=A2E402_TRIV3|nr:ribonuclease inhibitor domain-containing protein [Trichomonas vaginalis G3]EAY12657.1 hypothetical protein TVAG_074850 [Trichomonas vaginalis G3]KAI5547020.1 ribonuclease inhibitor domain-containing protein [Trichomonas vaginalis G3]|eukprot:XP_001324880.1 hypothetical protein [Trichomonas vaginalis G3]
MNDRFISIPEAKLQSMYNHIWSSLEQILIAVQADISVGKQQNSYNGFFILTYGALYFIKATIFGNTELVYEIPLLDLSRCGTEEGQLKLYHDTTKISVKHPQVDELLSMIISIFLEVTYKFKNPPKLRVRSGLPLQNMKPKNRPNDLFFKRTIALAHFYKEKSEFIENATYFRKQEENLKDQIIITPELQVGNMFQTYGTTIAYESKINTILFQAYTDPNLSDLLNVILSQTNHISQVIFSDYKEQNPITFKFAHEETSINRYLFMRCCGQLAIDFINASVDFVTPIQELALSVCTLRAQEFGDIITYMSLSPPATKLKKLYMHRVQMKPFPFDDITRLMNFALNLETVVFRGLEIDATLLLRTLCDKNYSHLKTITLRAMVFKTNISDDLDMPNTLLYFNVSQCSFTQEIFLSLLQFLTRKWHRRSIVFAAQGLVMKDDVFNAFNLLEFDKIYPNLCEIDLTGNCFSSNAYNSFFAFVNTQKRLHCLILNDILTDNCQIFLSFLAKLIFELKIKGIELSGNFNDAILSHFIISLCGASWISHLRLEAKEQCENSIPALISLLEKVTQLSEFFVDCFHPRTPYYFLELWKEVANSKSILATNLPLSDMEELHIFGTENNLDFLENLKIKRKISDISRRVSLLQLVPYSDYSDLKFTDENFDSIVNKLRNETIFEKIASLTSKELNDEDKIDQFVDKD